MTGLDPRSLDPASITRDSNGHPATLIAPTQLFKRAAKYPTFATGGRTHSILVQNRDAFSWGKNHVYECGQGHTDDIIRPKQLITGRERELRDWVWAGAGHQFGMLASHTRITQSWERSHNELRSPALGTDGHQFDMLASHTRNTQRWDRSRNELRSPTSATGGQAGPPEENDSSSSVSVEISLSGESLTADKDGQAEPSSGHVKSMDIRAKSYERPSEPMDSRIVSGNRRFPAEREEPSRQQNSVSGGRLPLAPAARDLVAEEPQEIVRTQKQPPPRGHNLLLAPKRVTVVEERQTVERTRTRTLQRTQLTQQNNNNSYDTEIIDLSSSLPATS